MNLFKHESIGIDLGTSNVRIFVKGKGIVLTEPSVVAVNKHTGEILAIGEEARAMLGRAPGNIAVVRPLRDGVISSYTDTERMLRYFLRKVIGRRLFFKPTVVICVPSGVTDVERRALIENTLLPQADATWQSALASYQVGEVDFGTLLEALNEWQGADLARVDALRDELLGAAAVRAIEGEIR